MTFPLLICLLSLLVMAAIGTPISLSMITSAIVYLVVSGQDLSLAGEQILNGMYGSFILLAVPLFVVAANLMNVGSISDRLLKFCMACVGRTPGGMGNVNIMSSLIFSGMSGSAVADAAGIGKVIIDMMVRSGRYAPAYAAAVTAASATIGPIIPPSIPMMLYAVVSNQSIGYLFLGGIVPGLLFGLVLMALNIAISIRRKIPLDRSTSLKELPRTAVSAFPALLLPVILFYGIYGGVTTPTEAAALAAAYAFLLAAFFYRSLNPKVIYKVFADSARASMSVGLVIGGSLVLNYVVAQENLPDKLAGLLAAASMGPLAFMFTVNALILVLGAFLDASTIILVVLPMFIPAAQALGVDLIHFGVIAVVNCMIGLITPPYGVLLFVLNAVTDIPLGKMIREVWIFVVVLIAALVVMILSPGLVLWLPRLVGYGG